MTFFCIDFSYKINLFNQTFGNKESLHRELLAVCFPHLIRWTLNIPSSDPQVPVICSVSHYLHVFSHYPPNLICEVGAVLFSKFLPFVVNFLIFLSVIFLIEERIGIYNVLLLIYRR